MLDAVSPVKQFDLRPQLVQAHDRFDFLLSYNGLSIKIGE
jgi:hypothetical protein